MTIFSCKGFTAGFIFATAITTAASATSVETEIEQIENNLRSAIKITGDKDTQATLEQRMSEHKVAGISVAVIKDGKLRWAKGYGVANSQTKTKVDQHTLFQAGSISKPVATLAAIKLAEQGKVNLDTDVNQYLKSWKVVDNQYTQQHPVTLRQLMNHTAGMTVHGFPGYANGQDIPTTTGVLDGKGNTDVITVDSLPGSNWRYSGGGYTVMQKVVEDVTGKSFEEYLQTDILNPLGMVKSTYAQPIDIARHQELSAAFDNEGKMLEAQWHNYPEKAAAGLWTTPSDLANYIIHLQEIIQTQQAGLLKPKTVKEMFTPNLNNWGLGPEMRQQAGAQLFQHGGKNAGFTNHFVAFVDKGDGMVIMTNSDGARPLIQQLRIAISDLYGWDIYERTELTPVKVENTLLTSIAGTYEFEEQVPGIDQYLISIAIEGDRLHIRDDNDGSTNIMLPVAELEFANVKSGQRAVFERNDKGQIRGFIWSGRWRFTKLN